MQTWLDGDLARLIGKYDVPAASVAVFADGEVSAGAAGVLNLNTGVEATTDAILRIGSVTKLWTTTLIMQLVAEGKVDPATPRARTTSSSATSCARRPGSGCRSDRCRRPNRPRSRGPGRRPVRRGADEHRGRPGARGARGALVP
ncbi:serine hydrolase [Kribbella turkmenica]|uniref:serine hydrolase n=1 Tax=Kribbella turkmenica TaxID=2530375 RepID=UPI00192DDA8D|nr:serine hydrolase domain-containing protein [Kribbella turkmenica]